jgi:hypothetical protein
MIFSLARGLPPVHHACQKPVAPRIAKQDQMMGCDIAGRDSRVLDSL